jgi:hypothetical protein
MASIYSFQMIALKPHTPQGFIFTGMALALLFFTLGFYGLPIFLHGYWNDEPIALVMFVLSALSALWLGTGTACGWIQIGFTRGNVLLNCWLAWVAWQIIPTLFAATPWRSWFGPPEQSEGLAWYLCASLLMLQFAMLWHSVRFRKYLLASSFAAMFILAVLHFISDERNNLLAGFIFPLLPDRYFIKLIPYVWPDYLGYMAAWWWLALMLTFRDIKLRWLFVFVLAELFILLASSNHGAFGLISYAILITLAVRVAQYWGLSHFREASYVWRRSALIVLLLPVVWLIASPYIKVDYKGGASQSIPARVLYNHISMRAIAHEPSRLLTGKGWGQSADDFYKYALIRDMHIYDNGVHKPNWGLIRGYNYHSHNMAAETLLSLGIIGFLLWLVMPILAIQTLSSASFWPVVPVLVAVTLLSHLWFALPQTMPFQALCWFLLIRQYPATKPQAVFMFPRSGALSFLLAFGLLVWSSYEQFRAIDYSRHMVDPYGVFSGKPLTAEYMQQDIKRGGDRLRTYFITTTKRMVQSKHKLEPKHLALYRNYIESAEAMAKYPRIGAYNGIAILYGYNVLLSNLRVPLLDELQKRMRSNYFEMALLHTKRAPYREDAIAPYLASMYESFAVKNPQKLMGVVQLLLESHPSHRSALWIGGKALAGQASFEQQGIDMMRSALALGADKVYMIPDKEIDRFEKLHGPTKPLLRHP